MTYLVNCLLQVLSIIQYRTIVCKSVYDGSSKMWHVSKQRPKQKLLTPSYSVCNVWDFDGRHAASTAHESTLVATYTFGWQMQVSSVRTVHLQPEQPASELLNLLKKALKWYCTDDRQLYENLNLGGNAFMLPAQRDCPTEVGGLYCNVWPVCSVFPNLVVRLLILKIYQFIPSGLEWQWMLPLSRNRVKQNRSPRSYWSKERILLAK